MALHTFVILAYHESDNLEECIKSILKQSTKSIVLIATSTPNDYIMDLASYYGIGVMVNNEESNKGNDYNFAISIANTKLVTIAHQDDLYNRNYTKEVVKSYRKNKNASIIFTDNYEIKDDKMIFKNKRLFRKRYYLYPLSINKFQNNKYFKMRCLKKEKFICTSSITFIKKNLPDNLFPIDYTYDNDWKGLIKLVTLPYKFVFIKEKLVGYRIDDIKENDDKIREDEMILKDNYPLWYYEKILKKK